MRPGGDERDATGDFEVWTFAGRPKSRWSSLLEVSCYPPPPGNDARGFLCAAWDGTESGLFAVDPGSGALTPKGRAPLKLSYASRAADGRMLAWMRRRELGVVDADAGEIVRMRTECRCDGESTALAWPHFAACEEGKCRVFRIRLTD